MRIREITEGNEILVGYKETGVFVHIVKFEDYMLGKTKTRYRVDVKGKTVASLIDTKAGQEFCSRSLHIVNRLILMQNRI